MARMNECTLHKLVKTTNAPRVLDIFINCYTSINQSVKMYVAPLQKPCSEALPTQAKQKRTVLRKWKSIPSCWTNYRKRKGLHCCRAGEWDHQITVDRGSQCMTACTRRERAAEIAQIGERPARHAPPHQGHDPV